MKFSVEAQQATGKVLQRVWSYFHAHQQQQQQQQGGEGGGALEGADASSFSKAFSSMQALKYMYGTWLTGALPALLDIMSNLLHIAQPDSSSSTSSSGGADGNARLRHNALQNLAGSINMLSRVTPQTVMLGMRVQ
jgi:hypothetical protein